MLRQLRTWLPVSGLLGIPFRLLFILPLTGNHELFDGDMGNYLVRIRSSILCSTARSRIRSP